MSETPKPFACTTEGCKMSFTNEDHLNVHQKKHVMVLNLGLGNKPNIFVADQTPTPTRFIRNCEEVGLFQDLQHVNPFEETFRRAIENGVLPVPNEELSTDDTLHTPHVLPHTIEDTLITTTTVTIAESPKIEHSSPEKFVLNEIDTDLIRIKKENITSHHRNEDAIDLTLSADDKADLNSLIRLSANNAKGLEAPPQKKSRTNLKLDTNSNSKTVIIKLKESILKNKQQKFGDFSSVAMMSPNVTVTLLENSDSASNASNTMKKSSAAQLRLNINGKNASMSNIISNSSSNGNGIDQYQFGENENNAKRSEIRARNRAAATRCRQRKKSWLDKIIKENSTLLEKNNDLTLENNCLRKEIIYLKTLLLQHKDCPAFQGMTIDIAKLDTKSSNVKPSPTSGAKYKDVRNYPTQILPKNIQPAPAINDDNSTFIVNLSKDPVTVIM